MLQRTEHQHSTQTAPAPISPPNPIEPRLIDFDHNQIEWRIADRYLWLVRDPDAPNWSRIASCPTAELVKRNEVREVWRVSLRDQLFYAKTYFSSGRIARLKNRLRGAACIIEWRTGWYARRHGIPAICPVACGLSTTPDDPLTGVLVTPALCGAVPLDLHWTRLTGLADGQTSIGPARVLTDRIAEAIARAHHYGFEHLDMHVGNLLIAPSDGAAPKVSFVDLHTVRINRPVTGRAVVRNLAQINQWFMRHASRSTRLRFMLRYTEWRKKLAAGQTAVARLKLDPRRVLPLMDDAARRHAARLWAKRDRRTRRHNKYFARLRLSYGWTGHAFLQAKHPVPHSRASSMRFSVDEWEQWLANPSRWLASQSRGNVIKDSPSGLVIRTSLPSEDSPLDVIVKAHRPRGRLKQLFACLRRSRDMRCWRAGYALLNRDVPTARPLAALDRRRFGLLRESLLICEAIPKAKDLDRWVLDDLPLCSPRTARRRKDRLIEALVRLFKRLESRGFTHRDCKASNIVVGCPDRDDELPRVWIVDLSGLRLLRYRRPPFPLHALTRLSVSLEVSPHVTRTDRLRFLHRFMLAPGRSDRDWKVVWKELSRRADVKRRRKLRRDTWKRRNRAQT